MSPSTTRLPGFASRANDVSADGTTIVDDIDETGGVAINPYGRQVAFHGKVGTTDAVLVGLAPVAGGEETSGE